MHNGKGRTVVVEQTMNKGKVVRQLWEPYDDCSIYAMVGGGRTVLEGLYGEDGRMYNSEISKQWAAEDVR